jgi:hypothetical protein
MDFELVIFDCDGVLVDTERLTVVVEARMLTELGWAHTPEQVVARFMGRTSESMLAELELKLGAEKTRWFDEQSTVEVHEAFDRELVAVAGVREVTDFLARSGVATCVASSGSHRRCARPSASPVSTNSSTAGSSARPRWSTESRPRTSSCTLRPRWVRSRHVPRSSRTARTASRRLSQQG